MNVRLLATTSLLIGVEFLADQPMAQTACDYLRVAREYIAERYPDFDPAGLKAVIVDEGNIWELSYELPPGTLGGSPTVAIDKVACRVVRSQHSQ